LSFEGNASAFSFGDSNNCPDFKSKQCLDQIRKLINVTNMGDAKESAESQCYSEPEVAPSERFSETLMLTIASGCFYLYSIESFLGNSARAYEARLRARNIASFGCENGKRQLCQLMVSFMKSSIVDLISEFFQDVKIKHPKILADVKLRHVRTTRGLPQSMSPYISNILKNSHKKYMKDRLVTCTNCDQVSSSYTRKALDLKMPKKTMDVGVSYFNNETTLTVKVYDFQKHKLIYRKEFSTQNIKKRFDNFGYNSIATQEFISTKKVESYAPTYKVMFGIGATKMKNIVGGVEYDNRLVYTIRSVERFNHRRSEFGLWGSYQLTQESANKQFGFKNEADATSSSASSSSPALQEETIEDGLLTYNLEPYHSAFSLYAVYSHMLIGIGQSYDGVRNGLHFGIGIYANSLYQALTARIGWDFYIAKSWVLTLGGVYINKSALELPGGDLLPIPAGKNFEFGMSYRL
jgi:hypothetical protein